MRPLGRALSVHQGKGATPDDAKLGALLEAVESDAAERFDADGPCCSYADLPPRERPPDLLDFAGDAFDPPRTDDHTRWSPAERIEDGRRVWVPFDAVSLDFTRGLPSAFDRASNGVATGATRDEAIAVALHELIERDAVTELRAADLLACMGATVRLDSVPFAWLSRWRERLRREGIVVRVHLAPSVTGTPAFACLLDELERERGPYRAIYGQGAHPLPELALFKALAEALQARATFIAGARDDLPPSAYRPGGAAALAFGLPPPPGMPGMEWDAIAPGPRGAAAIIEALASQGYRDTLVVDLARPGPFHVVRALVCGLGSLERRRRPPR